MSELPPEVRIHEPRLALDGGRDGLAVIRRLAGAARRYLRPEGALVVETAGGDQASAAAVLLREAGWSGVTVRADLAGIDRFVAGRA
jgi:release factor glutamine methyltransferase